MTLQSLTMTNGLNDSRSIFTFTATFVSFFNIFFFSFYHPVTFLSTSESEVHISVRLRLSLSIYFVLVNYYKPHSLTHLFLFIQNY